MILNHGFTNIFNIFNTAGSNSQNCIINNLFFFFFALQTISLSATVLFDLVSFRFVLCVSRVSCRTNMEHYLTTQFVQLPRMQTANSKQNKAPPKKKRDFSPAKTESEKCELRVLRSDGWCLLALLTLNWWPSDRNWRKNVTSLHSQLEGIGWIEGISRSHRSSQPAENVKLVYQPTGKAALMSV